MLVFMHKYLRKYTNGNSNRPFQEWKGLLTIICSNQIGLYLGGITIRLGRLEELICVHFQILSYHGTMTKLACSKCDTNDSGWFFIWNTQRILKYQFYDSAGEVE